MSIKFDEVLRLVSGDQEGNGPIIIIKRGSAFTLDCLAGGVQPKHGKLGDGDAIDGVIVRVPQLGYHTGLVRGKEEGVKGRGKEDEFGFEVGVLRCCLRSPT